LFRFEITEVFHENRGLAP